MQHGISAVSEALMAIGIIGVSILFLLSAGNLLGYQTQTVTQASEQVVVDDLNAILDRLASQEGTSEYWYDVPLDAYTIETVNNTVILVHAAGNTAGTQAGLQLYLQDATVSDSDTICITKTTGDEIILTEGKCDVQVP